MNLLQDSWMPVRRRNGTRDWIAPSQLSDPDLLAFDANRPDFNGALMQFAIGLLQSTTPTNSSAEWRRLLATPPGANELDKWFSPVVTAFVLDAESFSFMQEKNLISQKCSLSPVSYLLINSPAENTVKLNKDHFVKREHVRGICFDCAALALLTLQINAPGGGPGFRTSLRGAGPLTTILIGLPTNSLWQNVWLNVVERPQHLSGNGNRELQSLSSRFPWMAELNTLQKNDQWEISPPQVHPDHVYWAMPRRIQLDLNGLNSGLCDLCGRTSTKLVQRFFAKNYGLNYKGAWEHPLSPYYDDEGVWRPVHPQSGGFGYRHWLAFSLGTEDPKKRIRSASVVSHALNERRRQLGTGLRLWTFGYDIVDSMKARCWYESTVPLYGLHECEPDALRAVSSCVSSWLSGAQSAASSLRGAVKDAWFGGDARGDFSAVDAEFWGRTEAPFYQMLRQGLDALRADPLSDIDELAVRQTWHAALVHTALDLFDHTFVGTGPIERQKPHRVADARRKLLNNLYGNKMCEALRLPSLEKPATRRTRAASVQA